MKKLSLMVLFVLCSLTALAFNGKVMCTRADNISDQWTGILPGRPPFVPLCSEVVKGEPFSVRIFFSQPSIKAGMVKVGGKLKIIDPSGKVMHENKLNLQEFECKNNKSVFLFKDYIMISFDPPDKSGKYTYKVELQDLNDGKTVQAETSIELKENITTAIAKNLKKAISDYYRNQATQNIIPSFLWFAQKIPEMKQKQKRNFNPLSMIGVYYFMLKQNPQLNADFAKTVNELKNPDAAKCGAIILHELGPKAFGLLNKQKQAMWDNRMTGLFHVNKPVVPWQLDILWGQFLATGKKAPLVKIVNAMAKMDNNLSIQAYKAKKNPTKEDRMSLMRYLTGMAAQWSVGSNAKQHRLVAYYLEAMLCRGEIKNVLTAAKIAKLLSAMPEFKDTIKISVSEK